MRFPKLSRSTIEAFIPLAEAWGVSEVARSEDGFLGYYLIPGKRRLSDYWENRRENFLVRHLAQMHNREEPLWVELEGKLYPTPRHLALIMWAYSPDTDRLNNMKERIFREKEYPGRP